MAAEAAAAVLEREHEGRQRRRHHQRRRRRSLPGSHPPHHLRRLRPHVPCGVPPRPGRVRHRHEVPPADLRGRGPYHLHRRHPSQGRPPRPRGGLLLRSARLRRAAPRVLAVAPAVPHGGQHRRGIPPGDPRGARRPGVAAAVVRGLYLRRRPRGEVKGTGAARAGRAQLELHRVRGASGVWRDSRGGDRAPRRGTRAAARRGGRRGGRGRRHEVRRRDGASNFLLRSGGRNAS
mmetsp:Transcript_12454/g.31444  ORF Transcript_12454/g.31444 Transcript_12454/m.31444 type:complete len:234 (-) Transcript_12454:302-1003(-)